MQGDLKTLRSIPACAGEPGHRGRYDGRLEVDPRVCGGATTTPGAMSDQEGRSPRVRGSRHRRQ